MATTCEDDKAGGKQNLSRVAGDSPIARHPTVRHPRRQARYCKAFYFHYEGLPQQMARSRRCDNQRQDR